MKHLRPKRWTVVMKYVDMSGEERIRRRIETAWTENVAIASAANKLPRRSTVTEVTVLEGDMHGPIVNARSKARRS